MDAQATFEKMYAAFNARNIDEVFTFMADNVDWPKAFKGGRAVGKDAVREYWTEQWQEIDPTVIPNRIEQSSSSNGEYTVHVNQTVRDLEGKVLDHRQVKHVYQVSDCRIVRMDVVDV